MTYFSISSGVDLDTIANGRLLRALGSSKLDTAVYENVPGCLNTRRVTSTILTAAKLPLLVFSTRIRGESMFCQSPITEQKPSLDESNGVHASSPLWNEVQKLLLQIGVPVESIE
jgi:hypothetical protein